MVPASHLLVVPATAWHSATYDPATSPAHLNIALSPVQFSQVHWSAAEFAYALMQLNVVFFALHDITKVLLGEGVAGNTTGVPIPVLTLFSIVVVGAVVDVVEVEVETVVGVVVVEVMDVEV